MGEKSTEWIIEEIIKPMSLILSYPIRKTITELLFNSAKPLFYSEIKKYILQKYSWASVNTISHHLKLLEKSGILIKEIRKTPDISSGKARYSEYKLTKKGKILFNGLIELMKAL